MLEAAGGATVVSPVDSPPTTREFQLLRRKLEEASLSLAQSRAEASAHQDAAAAAAHWAEAVSEECEMLRQQLKASHSDKDRCSDSPFGSPRCAGTRSPTPSVMGTPASCAPTPTPQQNEGEDEKAYNLRCALQEREAEASALRAENASLQKELKAAMDSSENAASDVWEKVNRLTHHLEVINTEMAAERDRAEAAETRVNSLKKDLAKKTAEVNEMRGRAAVTESNLLAAQERLELLSKEAVSLRCERSRLEGELADTQRRLEYANTNASKLEARNGRLSTRLGKKATALANERSKRAALEATMSTLDTVRAELLEEMERFRLHQDRETLRKERSSRNGSADGDKVLLSKTHTTPPPSLSASTEVDAGADDDGEYDETEEVDLATAAARALQKIRRSERSSPVDDSPTSNSPDAPQPPPDVLAVLNRVHRSLVSDFSAMRGVPSPTGVDAEKSIGGSGSGGSSSSAFQSPCSGGSSCGAGD